MNIPNFRLILPIRISMSRSNKVFSFSIGFRLPSKRERLFFWQQATRGWSDDDTWSLDLPVSRFVLPRLKRFNELRIGHPGYMTDEEWDTIIKKMIFAFEETIREEDEGPISNESRGEMINRHNRRQEGLKLFGKYFNHLWW